jgi:vacuolar-type H+-ATPase subunit E/Vma4
MYALLISVFSQSSNMLNQARLKALKVREDHVESVLDDARQQLGNVNQDQGKYSQVLYSLILQGLLQVIDTLLKRYFLLKQNCYFFLHSS